MKNNKKYKIRVETLTSIGHNIRKRRKALGWTMMDLSYETDIEYRQIGRIERGETNFTILTLLRISVALDIKLKNLIQF